MHNKLALKLINLSKNNKFAVYKKKNKVPAKKLIN